MSDMYDGTEPVQRRWPVLPVIFALYVILSAVAYSFLHGQIADLQRRQAASEAALSEQIAATHKELRSSATTLAQQVGSTEQKLSKRAAELAAQQRKTQQAAAELAENQQKQAAELGNVSSEVSGVKTDVGGVKQDVTKTQSDLAATQAKLEHTIGDLGIQSGLIATTREDLEFLKHKGDRNYYEFTITKKMHKTPVSTVSLELKKADPKHGKYTLNVIADDKTIEKKDRNMNEPLQFYTGRDHLLYELVVFTVDKDKVAGYISTPKSAPVPFDKSKG
jgi:rubrerythrin